MSFFLTTCDFCGVRYRVPSHRENTLARCKKCGSEFTIKPQKTVIQAPSITRIAQPISARRKTNRVAGCFWWCFGTAAILTSVLFLSSLFPTPPRNPGATLTEAEAHVRSQDIVRSVLEFPRNARFHYSFEVVFIQKRKTWLVKSAVDVKNAFGATLTYDYETEFYDTAHTVYVKMNGEQVLYLGYTDD